MSVNLLEARPVNLEFEHIKQDIRASLQDPEEEWAVINGLFQEGEYSPTHSFSIIGVGNGRAGEFVNLIKKEIEKEKLKRPIKLAKSIDVKRANIEKYENIFEHELAHVKKAEELGLDLSKSTLRGYFTISNVGLDMTMDFDFPSTPSQKAQVAMAPKSPSTCDFACVRS